jgi:GYF domain 2
MAAGWIIKRNNKENGPFSPQQLKQLAASGKLKPEDLIRKEPGGKFQPAKSIKGLFPQESVEEAAEGDSAEFAKVDISRYGDLPMEEDDEDADSGSRKKRPPKGKGKKSASKSGKGKKSGTKGKSGKKETLTWLGWILGGFLRGYGDEE